MLRKMLLSALLLRLLLAFFAYHPDVLDQLNWGKHLSSYGFYNFYSSDIADAGPANYPPLYYLIIYANEKVFLAVKSTIWLINTNITIFPSKLFLWVESDQGHIYFNKILPIITDCLVGLMVFSFVSKFTKRKNALNAMAAYLFLPPSWYISSVWGQTDSLYLFPLLVSVYLSIFNKNNALSLVLFTIAFLIKPTSSLLLPLVFYININAWPKLLIGTVLSVALFLIVHIPFSINLTPMNIYHFYFFNIREISGYISSNAFNFWGITHGFGPISDSTIWFGLRTFYWGVIIAAIMTLYFIKLLANERKEKMQFVIFTLYSFSLFLFLTRMHERYFIITYLLLIISAGVYKKIIWTVYMSAFVFFVNLYHYWWIPGGDLLKYFLSNHTVETLFCLVNLFLFFYLERFREKIQLGKISDTRVNNSKSK